MYDDIDTCDCHSSGNVRNKNLTIKNVDCKDKQLSIGRDLG